MRNTQRVASLLKNIDTKLSIKKFAFSLLHYFVAKSLLWFASNALTSLNLHFSQVELCIIKSENEDKPIYSWNHIFSSVFINRSAKFATVPFAIVQPATKFDKTEIFVVR